MGYLGWAVAGALAVIVAIMVMIRTTATVRGNRTAPVGSAARTWAITLAFTDYWREAPTGIQVWVSGLNDVQYADVYQWLSLVITGIDRDAVDVRGPMLAHFVQTKMLDQKVALLIAEMSIADCRRLALVMENA